MQSNIHNTLSMYCCCKLERFPTHITFVIDAWVMCGPPIWVIITHNGHPNHCLDPTAFVAHRVHP